MSDSTVTPTQVQLYLYFIESGFELKYTKLLKLIAKKVIGNRAGRVEPKFIKKRSNSYRLLMQPRSIARAEVIKNGHPKIFKIVLSNDTEFKRSLTKAGPDSHHNAGRMQMRLLVDLAHK